MTYKELYEKAVANKTENEEVKVVKTYIDHDGFPAKETEKIYGFDAKRGVIIL